MYGENAKGLFWWDRRGLEKLCYELGSSIPVFDCLEEVERFGGLETLVNHSSNRLDHSEGGCRLENVGKMK